MRRWCLALAAICLTAKLHAQEVRLGVQTETSSIDPHYALVGANQVVAELIFEALLGTDDNMHPVPGLAAATQTADDIWEFRIRPGARRSEEHTSELQSLV